VTKELAMKHAVFPLCCSLVITLVCVAWNGCQRQMTMEEIKQSAQKFEMHGDEIYARTIIDGVGIKDPDVVFEALHSLQMLAPKMKTRFGRHVVDALEPLLTSDDPALLHSVTSTLIEYGEYAAPLLGKLQELVAHENSGAAGFAAEVIGRMGPDANSAQDCLVAALRLPKLTQQSAAESLSKIGPLNQKNLQLLVEFLANSRDFGPNSDVAIAVLMTDSGNVYARKTIESVFFAEPKADRSVRISTLRNIKRLKKPLPDWIVALLEQIIEKDPELGIRIYAQDVKDSRPFGAPGP
jgi:hypothetical protein